MQVCYKKPLRALGLCVLHVCINKQLPHVAAYVGVSLHALLAVADIAAIKAHAS